MLVPHCLPTVLDAILPETQTKLAAGALKPNGERKYCALLMEKVLQLIIRPAHVPTTCRAFFEELSEED